MQRVDRVWQSESVARTYLTGTRGAIPLAQEQLAVMERIIAAALPQGVQTLLDLGCGDGVLGEVLLDRYPGATGVFVDFSPTMLSAARTRLSGRTGSQVVETDYSHPRWYEHESIEQQTPFDVIVSGFSIHHQPDERKWALYAEIFHLLRPGGVFVNIEHVASLSPFGHALAEEHMLDTLWAYEQSQGRHSHHQPQHQIHWESFAQAFRGRADKAGNLLTPVETQCQWLRTIGFGQVDCYLKIFELALFAGVKPKDVW